VLSLWWAAVTACVMCCRCGGLLSLHASCAVAVVGCCHCMRRVLSLWWAADPAYTMRIAGGCKHGATMGALLLSQVWCALPAGMDASLWPA